MLTSQWYTQTAMPVRQKNNAVYQHRNSFAQVPHLYGASAIAFFLFSFRCARGWDMCCALVPGQSDSFYAPPPLFQGSRRFWLIVHPKGRRQQTFAPLCKTTSKYLIPPPFCVKDLTTDLRMYLELYTEMMFELPIKRNDVCMSRDEVVAKLHAEAIVHDCCVGFHGSTFGAGAFPSLVTLRLKFEKDQYPLACQWLSDLLWCGAQRGALCTGNGASHRHWGSQGVGLCGSSGARGAKGRFKQGWGLCDERRQWGCGTVFCSFGLWLMGVTSCSKTEAHTGQVRCRPIAALLMCP